MYIEVNSYYRKRKCLYSHLKKKYTMNNKNEWKIFTYRNQLCKVYHL